MARFSRKTSFLDKNDVILTIFTTFTCFCLIYTQEDFRKFWYVSHNQKYDFPEPLPAHVRGRVNYRNVHGPLIFANLTTSRN